MMCMFEIKNFFYICLFSYKYISKTSIFFSVILMRTHQKLTVKSTSNPPEPEKLNPAWCGFSNPKPTPTHTISTSNDVIIERNRNLQQRVAFQTSAQSEKTSHKERLFNLNKKFFLESTYYS